VNSAGQKASFSNFYLLEPAAKIAAAPTSLSTELSQEAVTLRWTLPSANVDGTTPANIIGFNVYRSPSEKQPAKLLNEDPVKVGEYRDEFFEFGKEYYYFVRTVSTGSGGEPVESGESNIVKIRPVDTFPPSAPAAVTLAATPATISIFFAANPEKDIAGYRVYRSTDGKLDRSKWELLTPTLLSTNTFQDVKVETGSTFFYYITAVDTAGNVSEASETVSETVP
jgi:fibronectin type 3 domain-containing protein